MKGVRILKAAAILVAVILVLTLGMVGYFYATARVSIAAWKAEGISAGAQSEAFESIKQQVRDKTFTGTLFQEQELGNAEDYAFITYTLRLNNQCLVPINMIEVRIVPGSDDVLQLSDLQVHSLNAKSQGEVTATILTRKDSHAIRELVVTYYVWGVSFTITDTYGG